MRLLIAALALSTSAVFAQSPAEDELMKAYQREYAFLAAQKTSLESQAQRVRASGRQKLADAERAIRALETESVKLSTANDRLFEEVQSLEKRRKDEQGREIALKSLWSRMRKSVAEHRAALEFRASGTIDDSAPETLTIAKISELANEGLATLEDSRAARAFPRAYINEEGDLVDGRVLRVGRIAAFAIDGGGTHMLGPGGDGELRVLESVPSLEASLTPLYAFESLRDKLKFKKRAGWTERLADLSPIIFLGMLFLMVGWLFMRLARI